MEVAVPGDKSAKAQLASVFASARQMRVPLMVGNILIIAVELIFG
jgi:hypothetical protein